MSISTVAQAEATILSEAKDFGTEEVQLGGAQGRVLAESLLADRDLPPCNRSTMDGIAISYAALERGTNTFKIIATLAAGNVPVEILQPDECVELMTGAALPDAADTVVRYEDLEIANGIAKAITTDVRKGQNVHLKGRDKRQGEVVARAGYVIDATVISMAASVGKSTLMVSRLPRTVIITTGDEIVETDVQPTPYQIRSSNNHTMRAALAQYGLKPDLLHIPDDVEQTRTAVSECLEKYDVIIMSGGVSMGKFDYVPQVLDALGVTKLFHQVQQRPGKPFWFGKGANGVLVFAFPGNPVSTFLCLHRYFMPWLEKSLKIAKPQSQISKYAVLDSDVIFTAPLQYFMQVLVSVNEQGQLIAHPVEGHGSGDFANLLDSNAFMELPLGTINFKKGEAYRIWPFKKII